MFSLLSERKFYETLKERTQSCIDSSDGRVVQNNLNVLIELCDQRLAIQTDRHINHKQNSKIDLPESVKNLNAVKRVVTSRGHRFECSANGKCGEQFSSVDAALKHVRKHAGYKRYECRADRCGFESNSKLDFDRHTLSHRN